MIKLKRFSKLFKVDDGKIINNIGYSHKGVKRLKKLLNDLRFDELAFGFQNRFEELLVEFVEYWVKTTGVKNVVYGGGVFMNVKGNMLLENSKELRNNFYMPSAGDESTGIGAAYVCAEKKGFYGEI